jgi:glycyl-tRNA synthetase beta chain
LKLDQLFSDARETYKGSKVEDRFKDEQKFWLDLNIFLFERVSFYLREFKGYDYDTVAAVLVADSFDIVSVVARCEAVKQVRDTTDFQSIAAACKRIRNILKQAREKGLDSQERFEYLADAQDEEKMLAAQLERISPRVESLRKSGDYVGALLLLSTVRPTVDTFFDKVMVMVDDERIRANRLALLQTLLNEFSTIADFSEIVTEGKESKESQKQ